MGKGCVQGRVTKGCSRVIGSCKWKRKRQNHVMLISVLRSKVVM